MIQKWLKENNHLGCFIGSILLPVVNSDFDNHMNTTPIRQCNSYDCGIACLSIITGNDYDQIIDWFRPVDFGKNGISHHGMDAYLVEHGYSIGRKFKYFGVFEKPPREKWPCEPFAEIHLCEVKVYENAPINHFVVMLRDGTVLDPLSDETKSLKYYHKIHNIAGIYKI
jgi:hypothetical protein